MDEQLFKQNQEQHISQKRTEEQNRVALIPKESFLNTETTMSEKKTLTKEELLERKKHNVLDLDIERGMQELYTEMPAPYTMDQAKDYLLHLPEINLTTDEAVVKNYGRLQEMKKEFVKISAFEKAFMDGKTLDPIFKNLYTALKTAIAYGEARANVIADPLYQKMTGDEVKALREKTENITPEEKALRKKLNACTVAEKVLLYGKAREEEGESLSIRILVPEDSAYAPKLEEMEGYNTELVEFLDEEVFEKKNLEFSEEELILEKQDTYSEEEIDFDSKEDVSSIEKIQSQQESFLDEKDGEIEELKSEMEWTQEHPEEYQAFLQEKEDVKETFTEKDKQEKVKSLLENRKTERRRLELSGVLGLKDHYTTVMDSRFEDLVDSDEMTQVKKSLFSLRFAVEGRAFVGEDVLTDFRLWQDGYYEDTDKVDPSDYVQDQSFSPDQIEEQFETVIRECQTYIESHGGFSLKAISRTGRERLQYVREAQERARKELRLFREAKEAGKLKTDDGAVKNMDEVYAEIHQRLDAEERLLPAVKKYISNGKRRGRDMAEVLSCFMVLEKEDSYRFGSLFSGEDSLTKQLLKEFASSRLFKEMGQLEAELLSTLKAQYDRFFALPVPAYYLKEGQDPFDESLRKQYALHRISVDGDYAKLRAMDRLHDFLTEGQKKSFDKAFQGTGGGKTEEMRSLCSAGGTLYQELKDLDEAGTIAPDLFSGRVNYSRESYGNQLKKGLADLVTPYEASLALKQEYDLYENTEVADYFEKQVNGEFLVDEEAQEEQRASRRSDLAGRVRQVENLMKEHSEMLFLVYSEEEMKERFFLHTDPDYVEKLMRKENPEGHVKRVRAAEQKENEEFKKVTAEQQEKALGYYAMSNLLGMEGAVRRVRSTDSGGADRDTKGILLEKNTGVSLNDLTTKEEYKVNGQFITKMSEKAEEDLAKITVLNILCGRKTATPEQLFCKVDKEQGIITGVSLGEGLTESFSEMSGKAAMRQLMQSAPQAIAKLSPETKKRILSMGPMSLASSFGSALKRKEMDALADRLIALQERIRKTEKEAVRLKNDVIGQAVKTEKALNVREKLDMNLTRQPEFQQRIDLRLLILGNDATEELKKVLKERIQKEEKALQKVYRTCLCIQRMNRVQKLNDAKDPAVAVLLENLRRDVETAKLRYNAAVAKEVERLENISRPEDVTNYLKLREEGS